MSIASATAKSGPYAGNGVTVAFAVGFACQAATDLVVVRTDASDLDATLTYVTDYSVVLNADQVASPGGTVTLAVAPAVGVRVTILRNVALTQGSQLPNQGAWYPKVVENALDKLTMIVQQLSEKVSRSVQVGVTVGDTSTFVAAIFAAASNAANAAISAANAANSAAAAAVTAASIALPSFTGNALRALRLNAAATAWEFFDAVSKAGGALTGALDEALGANIASATTINLTTATGNFVHVTGTTTIAAITIPSGASRTVIFDGALTLTHSAGLLLPGLANITTAAGDRMEVRGDTTGAVVVSYNRASGQAIIPSAMQLLGSATVTAAVANIDFLTLFTAEYDRYTIEIQQAYPSADDSLSMRMAVAGVPLAGASDYSGPSQAGSNMVSGSFVAVSMGSPLRAVNQIGFTGTVEIRNANHTGTNSRKGIGLRGSMHTTSSVFTSVGAEANCTSGTSPLSGFRLYWNSGSNFVGGTVRVYGHRNA